MTFQVNYNVPGLKSPGQVLEGWQVNTSVNFTGGFPINASDNPDDLSGTGVGSDRWTMVGDAANIDKQIGGPGPGVPCFGITGSSFGKTANCSNIAIPANATTAMPLSAATAAAYVANMPAACIQAAAAEPVDTGAPGSTVLPVGTANSTGLYSLASLGCYMSGSTVIVPPAQGTLGNMPYDALRGKAFRNWDFSVTKTWKFKERYSAQFRAEFFNVLNRTPYTPPGVSLASPSTFGESTSTTDSGNVLIGQGPRKIQLGLKIIF